jgi:hypothetical protein
MTLGVLLDLGNVVSYDCKWHQNLVSHLLTTLEVSFTTIILDSAVHLLLIPLDLSTQA